MNNGEVHPFIVLFDESNTPTFEKDRESDTFLGVSVSYAAVDEQHIFNSCDRECGLSNMKPLKNVKIHNSRIEKIAYLVASLPIQFSIARVDLSNPDFERVITLYRDFGNQMRIRFRKIKERPVSQILHSQIIDHCLFSAYSNYLKDHPMSTRVSTFIDDWAFSSADKSIALQMRKESIAQKVNDVFNALGVTTKLEFDDFVLLNTDSKRKRLIDVLTSVVSRGFKPTTSDKYVANVVSTVTSNSLYTHEEDDITEILKDFFVELMDEVSRENTPTV